MVKNRPQGNVLRFAKDKLTQMHGICIGGGCTVKMIVWSAIYVNYAGINVYININKSEMSSSHPRPSLEEKIHRINQRK